MTFWGCIKQLFSLCLLLFLYDLPSKILCRVINVKIRSQRTDSLFSASPGLPNCWYWHGGVTITVWCRHKCFWFERSDTTALWYHHWQICNCKNASYKVILCFVFRAIAGLFHYWLSNFVYNIICRGANPRAVDREGNTPLKLVSESNFGDDVLALLTEK